MQGVGPDSPVAADGSQSELPYAFHLIDAEAIARVAQIHASGAKKYGAENWRRMDVEEHLNHLITHAFAWLAGDRSDDHLANAACRALFALGTEIRPELSDAERAKHPRG